MQTKICSNSNCIYNGKEQPITNFYNKSGWCKDCCRAWQKENRKKNGDKINKQRRIRYEIDNVIILEQKRKYIESHKEEIKIRKKNDRNSFALYETNINKLEKYEECRRDPNNSKLIQVRCTYDNTWFNPTKQQVTNRLNSINGYSTGENRFYCSDGCKEACPIYWVRDNSKEIQPESSREVQPELRKMVLLRDNYICQKCDITLEELRVLDKTLHCHHIDPVINNPIESADVDNCITFCQDCHREAHQKDGCKLNQLKCR